MLWFRPVGYTCDYIFGRKLAAIFDGKIEVNTCKWLVSSGKRESPLSARIHNPDLGVWKTTATFSSTKRAGNNPFFYPTSVNKPSEVTDESQSLGP